MNYNLISPIKYSNPIEQILTNRGMNELDIIDYLGADSRALINPTKLKNIEQGVQMLIKHINAEDDIYIQIDEDCDGYCSSAILINYLNCLFPYYVSKHIKYGVHEKKEHGLIVDAVEPWTGLIIIPDAGSNEYEKHKYFKDRGIDILILDHHIADKESEDALVINNQLCNYPTKSLSGAGIVYKFCSYIDSLLDTNYIENYMDLTALALIADLMDTRDVETQYLIREGLRNVQNGYIKEMGSRNSLHFGDGDYLMNDVAWYIAPYINAVARMGTVQEKLLIFESMLDFKNTKMVPSTKRGCKGTLELLTEQAGRTSINIKNHQDDAADAAIKIIENMIQENNLLENKILPIVIPSGLMETSLNGLVANKLSNKYQRPCMVLVEYENCYSGSGRGYEKSGLEDFRKFIENSKLAIYAQGHEEAFGISFEKDNLQKFINYSNEMLKDIIDGTISYHVDYIWNVKTLPRNDILAIDEYRELWGKKVEEPLIALEHIKLNDETVKFIGKTGKTLRIDIPEQNMSIIKFYITDEEKEKLTTNGETWFANAIVKCASNYWNGELKPQLILEDIEIVEKLKYYF